VEGFDGKLLAYDTTVNTEFGTPPSSPVSATLTTPLMNLQQGMAYIVYFRYGNSDPNLIINSISVTLNNTNVVIGTIVDLTGAEPSNFISAEFTPPSNGIYNISVGVYTEGTQGLFYIDDILVQEVGVMGSKKQNITDLSFYPNPVKNIFSINCKDTLDTLEVYSTTGQLLLVEKPKNTQASLNLESFAPGIYLLNITSGAVTEQIKILKE